jgi:hypothetical protein
LLFLLADSVLPACSQPSGNQIDALQNLLLAVRQGKHAVSGSRSIFKQLAANLALSERERATAKKLYNKASEHAALEKQFGRKVFVELEPLSSLTLIANCWTVRLVDLSSLYLDKLVLIAENDTDARMYEFAAKHHKISKKLNGLIVACTLRGGGGSQINVEFASLLDQGMPAYAVTDSDRRHPLAGLSNTSKSCDAEVLKMKGVGWHTALPVHEAENLIPLHVLSEASTDLNVGVSIDHSKQLGMLIGSLNSNPANFTCVKNGKTFDTVLLATDTQEKKYWLSVMDISSEVRQRIKPHCVDKQTCSVQPCTCRISPGYGGNILETSTRLVST